MLRLVEITSRHNWIMSRSMCRVLTQTTNYNGGPRVAVVAKRRHSGRHSDRSIEGYCSRGGYSLYVGWYGCAAVLTPFFDILRVELDLFGVFFLRSFGVLKLPILAEFDLLGPKFNFSLDLFGSNFQWPAAHPHQFSDRVPPPPPPPPDFSRGDQWPTPIHPFCDHGDTCAFLLWATCERPTSSATFVRLFWTVKISRRPWCPCRGLNVLCATPLTTKATSRPPLCLQWRPGQFCGRTREAQSRSPCVKGV